MGDVRVRTEHMPEGDPCQAQVRVRCDDGTYEMAVCGMPVHVHRSRTRAGRYDETAPPRKRRSQAGRFRPGDKGRKRSGKRKAPLKRAKDELVIGIDGEGQGRFPHLYTYLAAVDEHGESHGAVENKSGLSTKECLDFLLSLPTRRVFGFAIVYDLTKILKDIPADKLYDLVHEDRRKFILRKGPSKGKAVFVPIYWSRYKINYMNRKLTVQRVEWVDGRSKAVGKPIAVWDVFRFFACKFTSALMDWKIADEKRLTWMSEMKDSRARFDEMNWADVKRYCQEECMYLAQLVRQLIVAHDDAGLPLDSFYGAGSTASSFLGKIGIIEKSAPPPVAMQEMVARAFFGGRFETSWVGPKKNTIYNYDISSAYPYQTTFLPCLTCGKWEHVTGRSLQRRVEKAKLALVLCRPYASENGAWGPLPWRVPSGEFKGDIIFPLESDGSWVWKQEALAAQAGWKIRFKQAWVYDSDCDCRPFADVPTYYLERLKLGKEGKGLVLKLGLNSIYGKLAQSKGTAKFNSWVWAGNITSGCRAQLLQGICSAKDPWNILMVATDGIFSTEKLSLPKPADTGTDIEVIEGPTGKIVRKPLGGWEEKKQERGIFLARPGIYFPLDPCDADIKEMRARGVSKSVLVKHAARLLEWWRTTPQMERLSKPFVIGAPHPDCQECQDDKDCREHKPLVRFIGMKTGVMAGAEGGKPYKRLDTKDRSRSIYGEWVQMPIELALAPTPKRRGAVGQTLLPWEKVVGISAAYDAAVKSIEGAKLAQAEMELEENPAGDWVEA